MRLFILCIFLASCSGQTEEESVVEEPSPALPNNKPQPPSTHNSYHKPYCPDIPLEIVNKDGSSEIVWVKQPCPNGDDYPSQPGPDPI